MNHDFRASEKLSSPSPNDEEKVFPINQEEQPIPDDRREEDESHRKSPLPKSEGENLEKITRLFSQWRSEGKTFSVKEFVEYFPDLVPLEQGKAFQLLLTLQQLQEQYDSVDINLPIHLGRYELIEKIGEGASGIVFRATQTGFSRAVAVKLLKNFSSSIHEKRFRQEANLASKLHHSNIVPVIDYGIYGGTCYLVMPFIPGGPLQSQVPIVDQPDHGEKEILPEPCETGHWRWVIEIGIQVSSALAYAHKRGMIHRDIKPSNLLVDEENGVWVTDFGLAKMLPEEDSLSSSGGLLGTPRYMAPEQLRRISDERSDIYSIGVTLWELVTGQVAWDDQPTADGAARCFNPELPCPATINPRVPRKLAQVISKACHYLPDARYTTANELNHHLRELIGKPAHFPWFQKIFLTVGIIFTICLGCFLSRVFFSDDGRSPLPQVDGVEVEPGVYQIDEGNRVVFRLPETSNQNEVRLNGVDAEKFQFDSATGTVTFVTLPDFELPHDSGYDNQYEFKISFRSGTTEHRKVVVADVDEPPQWPTRNHSNQFYTSVLPGRNFAPIMLNAFDPESREIGYRVVGGKDADLFYVVAAAFANPILVFKDPNQHFENPSANNSGWSCYEVILELFEREALGNVYITGQRMELENSSVSSHDENQTYFIAETPLLCFQFIDVASGDGKNFYVIQRNTDDTISLNETQFWCDDPDRPWQVETLSKNCRLPTDVCGLATHDGKTFYAVTQDEQSDACLLLTLELQEDGIFEQQGKGFEFTLTERVCSAECLEPDCLTIHTLAEPQDEQLTMWNICLSKLCPPTPAFPHVWVPKMQYPAMPDFWIEGAASWLLPAKDTNVSRVELFLDVLPKDHAIVPDSSSNLCRRVITMTIENNTETAMKIFELNTRGTRLARGTIQPGESIEQPTLLGIVWEFQDSNGLIWDAFEVTSRDEKQSYNVTDRRGRLLRSNR